MQLSAHNNIKPVLVFLHGLLGSKSDWQKVIKKLPHFQCIALDLPFHGKAKQVVVKNFEQTAQYLSSQIKNKVKDKPYFLIGYSLGGRLSLYYALQSNCEKYNLQGLILEGANLGLSKKIERIQRWQQDEYWIDRFTEEKLEHVLIDWYQQAVFSSLTEKQRNDLIQLRKNNVGENIANMIRATSLAKQPDLRAKMQSTRYPIYYFCGELDYKFRQIATDEKLHLSLISNAGHNSHQENSFEFAKKLEQLLMQSIS